MSYLSLMASINQKLLKRAHSVDLGFSIICESARAYKRGFKRPLGSCDRRRRRFFPCFLSGKNFEKKGLRCNKAS